MLWNLCDVNAICLGATGVVFTKWLLKWELSIYCFVFTNWQILSFFLSIYWWHETVGKVFNFIVMFSTARTSLVLVGRAGG